MEDKLVCIDCHSSGPSVEMSWPGYGQKLYPRCSRCADARLEREKGNIERNFSTGPTRGGVGHFDPADAGERFEDDY